MTISVTILGIPEVKELLKRKSDEYTNKANETVHKCGFLVEAEVKGSIAGQRSEPRSVDTGRFLNSITTNTETNFEASVQSDVEYAPHLEYGTTKIAPRRHFQNSSERMKEKVHEELSKVLS